jgi:[ribosomal protein S18]-alanine N-acetyltransferase
MVRPKVAAAQEDNCLQREGSELNGNPVVEKPKLERNAQTRRYNSGVPFAIRDSQAADFDTLWRIDQICFSPGIAYSRGELRFYMRRRSSFTLVAAEEQTKNDPALEAKAKNNATDQSVVGFLVAEGSAQVRGHIITIDVTPAMRRFGVGSQLLRAAEDRLKSAGCGAVDLETAVDNRTALAFYKRHGYNVVRTSPRYYSNGVDALVLEKRLS